MTELSTMIQMLSVFGISIMIQSICIRMTGAFMRFTLCSKRMRSSMSVLLAKERLFRNRSILTAMYVPKMKDNPVFSESLCLVLIQFRIDICFNFRTSFFLRQKSLVSYRNLPIYSYEMNSICIRNCWRTNTRHFLVVSTKCWGEEGSHFWRQGRIGFLTNQAGTGVHHCWVQQAFFLLWLHHYDWWQTRERC